MSEIIDDLAFFSLPEEYPTGMVKVAIILVGGLIGLGLLFVALSQ